MNFYRIKSWFYMSRVRLVAWAAVSQYKFRQWLFRWGVDEDGDIVFSIASVLHFVKYKELTQVKFGVRRYEAARKYVDAK